MYNLLQDLWKTFMGFISGNRIGEIWPDFYVFPGFWLNIENLVELNEKTNLQSVLKREITYALYFCI